MLIELRNMWGLIGYCGIQGGERRLKILHYLGMRRREGTVQVYIIRVFMLNWNMPVSRNRGPKIDPNIL